MCSSDLVRVKNGDYGYAVARVVNFVHELFVHLNDAWAEYMWREFGGSTE